MSLTENPPAARPQASPFWRGLLRLTGAFALVLFLTPTVYVIKYYTADLPRETQRAAWISNPQLAPEAKNALLNVATPDNLLLQAKVAEHDADPQWRRAAVRALGATLALPGVNWRRPLETVSAKAALAQVAAHDTDADVRAAASAVLAEIAQHGAVIRR